MSGAMKTAFSHVKPGDTEWKGGGLRDFFLYRDLGIKDATHGNVICHLVKANMPPEVGTGLYLTILCKCYSISLLSCSIWS